MYLDTACVLLSGSSQVGCDFRRQAVGGCDGERASECADYVRGGKADNHVTGAVHGERGAGCRADGITCAGDREAGQIQDRGSVTAVLDRDGLIFGCVAVDSTKVDRSAAE